MPLVSIIIPVYNRESSIEFCLKSISNMNCQDFEVIIIDDGSTDKTRDICNAFCESQHNFKYVYQANGGVSSARNNGLNLAKGKWVTFIDSDDAVCKEHLDGVMYEETNSSYTDLIVQGFTMIGTIKNNFEIPHCDNVLKDRIESFNPVKYLFSDYNPYCKPIFSTCGKFFKLSTCVQHVVKFNESISLDEDQLFVSTYLRYIKHLVYYPNANTYLFLDWGDVHLSGKMHSMNVLLDTYKTNYEAFKILYDKGGKCCINYTNNYIVEKTIKYILMRYTSNRHYKKLQNNELYFFIKNEIYPLFINIPTEQIYITDNKVRNVFKLIIKKHFRFSIFYCRFFSVVNSIIFKIKYLNK